MTFIENGLKGISIEFVRVVAPKRTGDSLELLESISFWKENFSFPRENVFSRL